MFGNSEQTVADSTAQYSTFRTRSKQFLTVQHFWHFKAKSSRIFVAPRSNKELTTPAFSGVGAKSGRRYSTFGTSEQNVSDKIFFGTSAQTKLTVQHFLASGASPDGYCHDYCGPFPSQTNGDPPGVFCRGETAFPGKSGRLA